MHQPARGWRFRGQCARARGELVVLKQSFVRVHYTFILKYQDIEVAWSTHLLSRLFVRPVFSDARTSYPRDH
jgi:hypothetical protein